MFLNDSHDRGHSRHLPLGFDVPTTQSYPFTATVTAGHSIAALLSFPQPLLRRLQTPQLASSTSSPLKPSQNQILDGHFTSTHLSFTTITTSSEGGGGGGGGDKERETEHVDTAAEVPMGQDVVRQGGLLAWRDKSHPRDESQE